jgi:hypothetical protein
VRSKSLQRHSAAIRRARRERNAKLIKDTKRREKIGRKMSPRVRAQFACHVVFDRLWAGIDRPLTRWAAYEYLQRITRLSADQAHIRNFDVDLCELVEYRVKEDYPELFGK